MIEPKQLAVIHDFNDKYRLKFNPDLFVDSDVGIIDEVKKVILSCERNTFFTIKVEGFDVIEDYTTIMKTLFEYEELHGYKNKSKENVYSYINLKDSDVRLLVVKYYIAIKDQEEHITVLIAIPRTVDRYYFRIGGNMYSALWQIVDASTYNSSTSSSKKQAVTLKTTFQPVRIYRYITNHKNSLKDCITGEEIKCTFYTSYIFKKSLPIMKYILAKFGYYGTMKFLHLDLLNLYDHNPILELGTEDVYLFNRFGVWITIPRPIFNKDQVVQSFVFTLYNSILKNTSYNDLFTGEYWLLALAAEFNNLNIEKGVSILDSLEFIYDISTKETLRLDENTKKDIYSILKWMMGEFNSLRIKDNLNVTIKRLRRPEYIASLYAMKLSTSIYRVSDIGKKANIDSIKKAIITHPMYLVNAISSCKLINYRNFVGDLDAMVALKFTYKGLAGIGENNNSMPNIYRAVNPSHLGIIDLDSSSAGDPGASGTLVPKVKTYPGGFFSVFEEPNTWEAAFTDSISNYKALKGYKESLVAMNTMLGITKPMEEVNEYIDGATKLIKPLIKLTSNEELLDGFPMEESGLICYETLEEIDGEGV